MRKIIDYIRKDKALLKVLFCVSAILLILFIRFFGDIANHFFKGGVGVNPMGEMLKLAAQLIGGIIIGYGLYLTYRRTKAIEDSVVVAQQNVKISEDGNVTERFKNAIEHLGRDEGSIRLGGIYSLHRIAKKSPEDTESVCNIFCSYLISEAVSNITYKKGDLIAIKTIADLLFKHDDNRLVYASIKKTLSNVHFVELNLDNGNISNCKFTKTSIVKSTFFNCVIEGSSFKSSILNKLNFSRSKIKNVRFDGCELKNTGFFKSNWENVTIYDSDLKLIHMSSSTLINITVWQVFFNQSNLEHLNISESSFLEVSFENSYLDYSNIKNTSINKCDMKYACLKNVDLSNSEIINSDLKGVNFSGANLSNCDFKNSFLIEADMSGATGLTAEQLLQSKTLYNIKGLNPDLERELREKKPPLFLDPMLISIEPFKLIGI